jgi:hypothetical protein
MLKSRIDVTKNDSYSVDFAPLAQNMRVWTYDDYSVGQYGANDVRSTIQRLFKAGFVNQTVETLTYPNVAGEYRGNFDFPEPVNFSKQTYSIDISMVPDRPEFSGEYTYDAVRRGEGEKHNSGQLHGTVAQDGNVTMGLLITGEPWQYGGAYKFSCLGKKVSLTGPYPFDPLAPIFFGLPSATFVGTGPCGSISVRRFTYSFSDKLTSLFRPNSTSLVGGHFAVDEVTDLLLETETIAEARFTWHVDLNEAARALLGRDSVRGNSGLTFQKQPDGNWVLTHYNF